MRMFAVGGQGERRWIVQKRSILGSCRYVRFDQSSLPKSPSSVGVSHRAVSPGAQLKGPPSAHFHVFPSRNADNCCSGAMAVAEEWSPSSKRRYFDQIRVAGPEISTFGMCLTISIAGNQCHDMESRSNYSTCMVQLMRVTPNIESAWAESLRQSCHE